MRSRLLLLFLAALFVTGPLPAAARSPRPVSDVPFWQDYHEACPLPSAAENDVRAVAVDLQGRVWAATAAGVRYREEGRWKTPPGGAEIGGTHALCVDESGRVWAAAWNGLWLVSPARVERAALPDGPVSAIAARGSLLYAAGPEAIWRSEDGKSWDRLPGRQWHRAIRAILPAPDGRLWIGTASGLYLQDPDSDAPAERLGTPDTLLSSSIYELAALPDGGIAVGTTGGVDFYRRGKRVRTLSAAGGMPNRHARAIAPDGDGRLWIATKLGVARLDGQEWSLRHSRRWLQSDDARDVAISPDGTAWVATAAGVDAIRRRRMTLAQKADHFLGVLRARHLRLPGLVGPAVLEKPGDHSRSFIEDDDNDGQHTGQYLAVESMRYAVTRDPAARENAGAAFGALCFLQEATGTRHFIARSVLPMETPPRHEVDRTFTPEEIAEIRRRNPREKIIEKRWLPTADGRWRWKRDASSDEVVGHLFGYAAYYDLAADAGEKRRVAEQVDRIVGGIVDHGFVLRDIDGAATQWGNWSPASLNHDPTWHEERNGNSAEILAHLGVAYHITGKAKYRDAARLLVEEHGYGRNLSALSYPTPSERTHINDLLLSMVFPNLFSRLVLPSLRPAALSAIRQWHRTCRADGIPLYDFVYNRFSGRQVPLGPAVETLRDWPLDLIEWTVDNRSREDVVFDQTPGGEEERLTRILPRSEMGLVMWDGDPYRAVHGRGGDREEKGTDWLLAYWMGRYWGLLAAPEPPGEAASSSGETVTAGAMPAESGSSEAESLALPSSVEVDSEQGWREGSVNVAHVTTGALRLSTWGYTPDGAYPRFRMFTEQRYPASARVEGEFYLGDWAPDAPAQAGLTLGVGMALGKDVAGAPPTAYGGGYYVSFARKSRQFVVQHRRFSREPVYCPVRHYVNGVLIPLKEWSLVTCSVRRQAGGSDQLTVTLNGTVVFDRVHLCNEPKPAAFSRVMVRTDWVRNAYWRELRVTPL